MGQWYKQVVLKKDIKFKRVLTAGINQAAALLGTVQIMGKKYVQMVGSECCIVHPYSTWKDTY